MKASNIILLIVFLSVIIGGTLLLFVGLYEVKQLGLSSQTDETVLFDGKTNEVAVTTNAHSQEKQTLRSFNTLIVRGSGAITLNNENNENFIYKHKKDIVTQNGDSLIIDLKTSRVKLNYTNIKNIVISDNVYVNCNVFSGDIVNVHIMGNTNIRIKKLQLNHINIKSEGTSSVIIEKVSSKKQNVYAKCLLSDNAKLQMKDSNNLNLEINKSGNAQCRIY